MSIEVPVGPKWELLIIKRLFLCKTLCYSVFKTFFSFWLFSWGHSIENVCQSQVHLWKEDGNAQKWKGFSIPASLCIATASHWWACLKPNHFLSKQMREQLSFYLGSSNDITLNPRNPWCFAQDFITKCWRKLIKKIPASPNTWTKTGQGEM